MVTEYPFDRPKKVIYNEKKRLAKSLTPQSGFVVRDLSVYIYIYTYMCVFVYSNYYNFFGSIFLTRQVKIQVNILL